MNIAALLAQVDVAPPGLASSQFSPLIWVAVVYALLTIASNVMGNRNHPKAGAVADGAFGLLLLTAVYVLVLLITAISSRADVLVRMVEVLAVVVAFFALLLAVLFALSVLFGLVGRLVRRDRRVTAEAGAPPPASSS